MSKFKVDIVGIDTNKLKVLKNDEMATLFKKFKDGDKMAKEDIINGNLKLVLSIISKFRNKNLDMNDLFQVGCVGLIKAVDNFDPEYGVMFSTYAVPLILGEVKRLIRTNSSVRIARSIRDTAYRILKFKEEIIKEALNLELQGNVVITPIFPINDTDKDNFTKEEFEILGRMHKEKIKISDAILVVNVDGYIGNSTQSEIEYAKSLNKEIIYYTDLKEKNERK